MLVAEFNFGTVIIDDDMDVEEISTEENCINCGDEKHVPDNRTGLIHKHGKYQCFQDIVTSGGNVKRVSMDTVAE